MENTIHNDPEVLKRILELQVKMRKNVDECGVSVMGVGGEYSYSIGLLSHQLPELLVYGMGTNMELWLINTLTNRFKKDGLQLGVLLDVIAGSNGEPLPLYLYEVPIDEKVKKYIMQSHNFYITYPEYKKASLRLVQVLWPDTAGRLPFEKGYDHESLPQRIFAHEALMDSEVHLNLNKADIH